MLRRYTELKLFVGAYVLYNAGRWVAAGDLGVATDNAEWIVDREEDFGVAVEHSVQDAFDSGMASWLLSHTYLAAQLVVLPLVLLAVYRWAPRVYRPLRDTVLATWLISIPIYAAFPVAPPRLAGMGFTDSVNAHGAVGMTGRSSVFYNELAAVPSLHCGFAMAISFALAAAAKRPLTKALAMLWGPLVCLTVVATGNHYVFDIAAGLIVALAGYGAGRLVRSWSEGRRSLPVMPVGGRMAPEPA